MIRAAVWLDLDETPPGPGTVLVLWASETGASHWCSPDQARAYVPRRAILVPWSADAETACATYRAAEAKMYEFAGRVVIPARDAYLRREIPWEAYTDALRRAWIEYGERMKEPVRVLLADLGVGR